MLSRLSAVLGWLLNRLRRRRVPRTERLARVPVTNRYERAWPWWAGPECLDHLDEIDVATSRPPTYEDVLRASGIDPDADLLDPAPMPGQLVFTFAQADALAGLDA
jgi:hypothetical protein